MKKKIIIPAVILLALIIAAISFAVGRKSAEKSSETPYITVSEFKEANKTVDKYVADFNSGGNINPDYLVRCYGISESEAKDFFENPGEWLCYDVFIDIHNSSNKNLYFFGLKNKDNGKNGVYVFTGTTSILGIPAGGVTQSCVSVLVSNGDMSDAEAESLVRSMPVSIAYAEKDEPDDSELQYANLR